MYTVAHACVLLYRRLAVLAGPALCLFRGRVSVCAIVVGCGAFCHFRLASLEAPAGLFNELTHAAAPSIRWSPSDRGHAADGLHKSSRWSPSDVDYTYTSERIHKSSIMVDMELSKWPSVPSLPLPPLFC